jgi:hypothetical protein
MGPDVLHFRAHVFFTLNSPFSFSPQHPNLSTPPPSSHTLPVNHFNPALLRRYSPYLSSRSSLFIALSLFNQYIGLQLLILFLNNRVCTKTRTTTGRCLC